MPPKVDLPLDNDNVYGKVYLVKIKFSSDFNSEDFLWAIARVGRDRFDCEDFQNIVCQLIS